MRILDGGRTFQTGAWLLLALLVESSDLNAQSRPDYSPAPALSFFGLPGLIPAYSRKSV